MKNLPENELFSAYLDGELTAAEQAQVEQLLSASPAARQLMDELRALSSTLQSLPQEKVGEDLSARVLRTAERRMLTETGPGDDGEEPAMPLWRQTLRGMLSGRALVWSGLAVAIGLMIAFLEPNKPQKGVQQGQQIALAPPKPENATSAPAEKRSHELTIQAAPAVAPPPAAGLDRLAEKKLPSAMAAKSGEPRTADKVAKKSSVEERRSLADKDKSTELRFAQAKQEVVRQEIDLRKAADEKQKPGGMPQQAAPRVAAKAPMAPLPPGAASGEGGSRGAGAGAGNVVVAQSKAMSQSLQNSSTPHRGRASPDGILVVTCDVGSGVAGRQTLEKLLADNGIASAWHDSNAGFGGRQAKAKPATADVMRVEATPEQIRKLLEQLAGKRDAFPAISIAPAAGIAWQQDLGKYNRLNNELAADGALRNNVANKAAQNGPQDVELSNNLQDFSGKTAAGNEMSKGAQNGRQVLSSEELQRNQNATQNQPGQSLKSARMCSVLFVLRRIDVDAADEAKPALPAAATPAAAPAKRQSP